MQFALHRGQVGVIAQARQALARSDPSGPRNQFGSASTFSSSPLLSSLSFLVLSSYLFSSSAFCILYLPSAQTGEVWRLQGQHTRQRRFVYDESGFELIDHGIDIPVGKEIEVFPFGIPRREGRVVGRFSHFIKCWTGSQIADLGLNKLDREQARRRDTGCRATRRND